MYILIYENKHYCVEDMEYALKLKGHSVERFIEPMSDDRNDSAFEKKLEKRLEEGFDAVFSFNYYPVISKLCNKSNNKYISWVYDSPLISLYSYTIINKCNYVFIFDYGTYIDLKNKGIETVYYLPLAVSTRRISAMGNPEAMQKKHACDVAFVGSMYDEKKQSLYSRLYGGLDEYTKGYMDSVINTQYNLYGIDVLEKSISNEKTIKALQKSIFVDTNPDGVETPAYTFANYFMARRVTELERKAVVALIMDKFDFHLYTHKDDERQSTEGKDIVAQERYRSANLGPVDYYNEMPYVFKNAKINLNITLRSIKTGIPLRIFDIMGSGGLVLTNYQQEMNEYFRDGVDYVSYSDISEIPSIIDYLLEHEDERKKIALSGYIKVKEKHNFENRVDEIMKIIEG